MRKVRVFWKLCLVLMAGLVGCTVQKAPGAYAPAKNRIDSQKLQQVASDTVNVNVQPENVVRIMGGSANLDTLVKNTVAVEPSPEVQADPEMTYVVSEVEDSIKRDSVPTTLVVNPILPTTAEKEITRSEKFTVVPGQGKVELKKYHVVIGSFGKRENALNLQSQMKPDYQPILVVNERGMFRVILVSFDTYQEAKDKINDIKDQFPDAWCLVQMQ